jgi:sec-independent protein translocase protein TatB
MFDIGWGELVVIGVVALIAIGPKELPGVLRATGQWMGKIRRMANEFQDQFREAMREAEMEDLKKKVDDATSAPDSFTNFDPIGTVRKEVEGLMNDGKPKSEVAETAAASAPAETAQPAESLPTEPNPEPTEKPKAGEGA